MPYWEDIPNEHALNYCIEQYNKLKAAYPDKPIIIGEIGCSPSFSKRVIEGL